MSPLSGCWETWSRCLFPLELVQIKGLHGEEEERAEGISIQSQNGTMMGEQGVQIWTYVGPGSLSKHLQIPPLALSE